jgi:hypothetical protein
MSQAQLGAILELPPPCPPWPCGRDILGCRPYHRHLGLAKEEVPLGVWWLLRGTRMRLHTHLCGFFGFVNEAWPRRRSSSAFSMETPFCPWCLVEVADELVIPG